MIAHGQSQFQNLLGGFIFFSRRLKAPISLGLIRAQAIDVYQFFVELAHLAHKVFVSHESETFTGRISTSTAIETRAKAH